MSLKSTISEAESSCGSFDLEKSSSSASFIEINELKVSKMGCSSLMVRLTCTKRKRTLRTLCLVFESLDLNVVMDNTNVADGKIHKTLVIEAEEHDRDAVKKMIEEAIAAANNSDAPI